MNIGQLFAIFRTKEQVDQAISDALVSGTSIKTVNGVSLLGSGDATADVPMFSAYQNTPYAPTVAGWSALKFNTAVANVGDYYSTTTGRFTPPKGWYSVSAAYLTNGGVAAGQYVIISLWVNGVEAKRGGQFIAAAQGSVAQSMSTPVYLDGSSYVEAYAFLPSGVTILGSGIGTYFSAFRVSNI